jgi:hypothetical protein
MPRGARKCLGSEFGHFGVQRFGVRRERRDALLIARVGKPSRACFCGVVRGSASPNRSRSRGRARYRALAAAGEKRVAAAEQT